MVLLPPCASQRGLTLYELVIVLAIVALVSVGVAGIAEWVERSRAIAQVNNLISDLSLARSEAIKRGQAIVLCASKNGDTCTGRTSWGEGYIIFVDANGSKAREAAETIIGVRLQQKDRRLEYRGFGSHSYIVYQPSGVAANNGTFTVCPRTGRAHVRAVVISATGRARSGTRTAAQAARACGLPDRS